MSPTRPTVCRLRLLLLLAGGTLVSGGAASAVDLCHAPPGDVELRRVIRVSPSAAERHLARHDDSLYLGAERCNGADDDCDGGVDESFPLLGRSCSAGLGVCAAAGSIVCDPADPSRTRCDAEPLPPLEPAGEHTCEGGLDEDCDGLLDADDPDCDFHVPALPSLVDLPITIDCCDAFGPGCDGRDYCARVQEPVNPCELETGEVVSCLEFSSVPAQNACWSVVDGTSPSITSPPLIEIVESGAVAQSEAVFLDNGDKSVVIRAMHDRMYGFSIYEGDPAGVDRYPPFGGFSDSWVVRLPVVECQDVTQCAGGAPQEIVDSLCFEIREILSPPYDRDRAVKGRFLCPETDPELFEECQLGPAFVDY